MNIPTDQLSHLMRLMTDLCNLLKSALEQETETDISSKIGEMMLDLKQVRELMEWHTTALDALLPAAMEMQSLKEGQKEMQTHLIQQSKDMSWLHMKLSQKAFREQS